MITDTLIRRTLSKVAVEDPGNLRFVAQVLGVGACPKCDYIEKHCRCQNDNGKAAHRVAQDSGRE